MPRPRTLSDAQILAATGRAIGRHGLTNLTLATVAAEVGMAPATLVQRFGSKRGLLLAFAKEVGPGARRPFEQARRLHDSPLGALRAALTGTASGLRSREEVANHLTFLHLDLTDAEFHEHARTHALLVREEIAALLEDAAGAGELAEGTDCARLARALQVTLNGALIVWALTGEGTLPDLVGALLDDTLAPVLCTDQSV